VNRQLSLHVRERAGERCEYCRLPQSAFPLPFQIDHVRAEKHGGETTEGNLALACTHCNRHKGPDIAGFDAETGQLAARLRQNRRKYAPGSDVAWPNHKSHLSMQPHPDEQVVQRIAARRFVRKTGHSRGFFELCE